MHYNVPMNAYDSFPPHIVLDATATPLALKTGTLSREDWRLMLISLHWIHERYAQHPENAGQIHWTSQELQGFIFLLQTHPKIIRQWRQSDPCLEELLHDSPVSKGIWQAFRQLEAQSICDVTKLPFYLKDRLYPLERYLKHRATGFELARFTTVSQAPTLIHSLGLPISPEHAHGVDVITLADLSILKHKPHASRPHVLENQALLRQQLNYLNETHRIITWDSGTVEALLEAVPYLDAEQIIVAPPCWFMEIPPVLIQDKQTDISDLLDAHFTTWCQQHDWQAIAPVENRPDIVVSEAEMVLNTLEDALPISEDLIQGLLELTQDPDIEVQVYYEENEEEIKSISVESLAKENKELVDEAVSDSIAAIPVKQTPEFLILSLQDAEHEDFESTLSLAFMGILDALSYLPDRADQDQAEGIERLAVHLLKHNTTALKYQSQRRILVFYRVGGFQQAYEALNQHALYRFVKDRVCLLPSTPYNKAMMYPKGLAFCACPTGEAFYPTLLEALAYSLPIVLPKQLCFELMAQGGGLFYHPDRPTKIPKLLANLSEKNGGKAKAAKWKARQTAETRSWQRFGEQIWKVYQL